MRQQPSRFVIETAFDLRRIFGGWHEAAVALAQLDVHNTTSQIQFSNAIATVIQNNIEGRNACSPSARSAPAMAVSIRQSALF